MSRQTFSVGSSARTPFNAQSGATIFSQWTGSTTGTNVTGAINDESSRPVRLTSLAIPFSGSGGSVNLGFGTSDTGNDFGGAVTASGTVTSTINFPSFGGNNVYYGFKKNSSTRTTWYRSTSGSMWINGSVYTFPDGTSGTIQATITQDSVPNAPTNLQGESPTSTTVYLSWTACTDSGGPGLSGYRILARNVTDGGSWYFVSTTTSTTFTVGSGSGGNAALVAGKSYEFAVAGYNAVTTLHSSITSVNAHTGTNAKKTVATIKPVVAAQGTISAVATGPNSVSLTWSTSNEPTFTEVSGTGMTTNYSASATNFAVNGLTPNTTYTYTIKTYNSANSATPDIATVSVRTWLAAPTLTITATALSSTTARVVWSSSNADSVTISGPGLSSTAFNGNEIVSNLTAATNYRWTGTADNADNPILNVNSNTITTFAVVGGVWTGSEPWGFPKIKVYNGGSTNWSDAPAGVVRVWTGSQWKVWA